jgi:tetrahydromethanopterin S-methyltransferase subunit A
MSSNPATWPVLPGAYQVGDPWAPVAVCALTSQELIGPLAQLAGVAIAGNVYTANHGIERIVVNVVTNPAIRFLLLCGKEASLFRPGQSLASLAERGVDTERRIIGAAGYEPILPTVTPERVAQFRRQVELVDWSGEEDLATLEDRIRGLVARSPGRFAAADRASTEGLAPPSEAQFVPIRPGGVREPLQYDPKGYFVITLDREAEQIVMRHYLSDHSPAHEMRGRSAGPMLLGLLREGLVTQLSHAGYLGEELAKAQAALQFGLRYDQDRPLRAAEASGATPGATDNPATDNPATDNPATDNPATDGQATRGQADAPAEQAKPARMPPIGPAATLAQVQAAAPGSAIDVVVAVAQILAPDRFVGTLLEPDEADPFGVYHRSEQQISVHWTSATRIVMGGPEDVGIGALLRARGTLGPNFALDAQNFAILTRVARIAE